jgi:hypothetical protein
MRRFTIALLLTSSVASLALAAGGTHAQAPPVPVPRPFPGAPGPAATTTTRDKPTPATSSSGGPQTAAPQAPAGPLTPVTAQAAALDPLLSGIAIFPTADFLDSYDAGQGQRYFIFGTSASFLDVVAYYKTTLRNGGRELFKTPGMQQFDLGRFQEQSMAYPPSIVVKDYVWDGSVGYLYVKGRQEKRYPTVIQIVPR